MSNDEESLQGFYEHITPERVVACIEAGADPTVRGSGDTTPLHAAAFYTRIPAAVAALIDAGADPDARARGGMTPLHSAAMGNENAAVVEALLEAGADPHAQDDQGRTPLEFATLAQRPADVIAVLKGAAGAMAETGPDAGSDEAMTPAIPLEYRVLSETTHLIEELLAGGADPSTEIDSGLTLLHMAAGFLTDPEILRGLIAAGADANARIRDGKGMSVLHTAAKWNANPDVIALLLDAGADPHAREERFRYTALHTAARFNANPAITQTLLDAGADANAQGRDDITPLHRAATSNPNPEVVETLLRGGADPTAQDITGRTPLETAKDEGRPAEIVAALEGAPLDCKGWMTNDEGLLRKFYENVTPDIARDCLQAGFDPNMRGLLDATPLHVASYYTKFADVIALLVGAGADINARSQGGLGALHFAAMWNSSPAVIAALVDAGADPRAQNDEGTTPLDIAKIRRRPADIIAALEDAVRAAESAIAVSPQEPDSTAGRIVGAIAERLEQWFASGAYRLALTAPVRAEEDGDDTVTVRFPGARLVERDSGDGYALGDIALEVTAEDDTEFSFDAALPPVVEMFTGNGRADGRITVEDSEISGLWRADLGTASILDAAASDLRVSDERGRETFGIGALTLSSTVDRDSDQLWEGQTRVTLSDLRVAPDLPDEGLRLGGLEIATTVEDAELNPFQALPPAGGASGSGNELEALQATLAGFIEGRFGQLEVEIALRDLAGMDGGEVTLGIGEMDWLVVLDDRGEFPDLAITMEATEPRVHEDLAREFSTDLIPGSVTVDIALERYPLRRIAATVQELVAPGSAARQGTLEQAMLAEMAGAGTMIAIHNIRVAAPAFEIEAEGQLRIDAESLLGAVGGMDLRIQGIGNVVRWAAGRGETEMVDSLIYLQGLGKPTLSGDDDALTYAYEMDLPRDGAVTVNDIPLDSLLKRLGVGM